MRTKKSVNYCGIELYNDTDIFVIVEKNTRIVVSEFIATNFVDYSCSEIKMRFVDYLQKRKENICKSLGFNSKYFGVAFKNYGYNTYKDSLMCIE